MTFHSHPYPQLLLLSMTTTYHMEKSFWSVLSLVSAMFSPRHLTNPSLLNFGTGLDIKPWCCASTCLVTKHWCVIHTVQTQRSAPYGLQWRKLTPFQLDCKSRVQQQPTGGQPSTSPFPLSVYKHQAWLPHTVFLREEIRMAYWPFSFRAFLRLSNLTHVSIKTHSFYYNLWKYSN